MRGLLLIGNGPMITRDARKPFLEEGCVAIHGESIAEIGSTATLREKYPAAEFLDAEGGLIMPGMINTHMHFYSSFARGMDLKAESPHGFDEILRKLWWRLDRTLTLEDVYYSASVAMIDCIKNGVTTVFDHHASPNCVTGSLFRIADAADKLGLRTCLCYEVSDRDGEQVATQGIEENSEYIRHCNKTGDLMRKGLFGLHASFTLNDDLLRRCTKVASELGTGCHIHTAEALSDEIDSENRFGKRVTERLADFDVLGPKSIAAHCVQVNKAEIEVLRSTEAFVAHNPESNMGNAVGYAPVLRMMMQGVKVGLGTDGYTCDMLESLKTANVLHKHERRDPRAAWAEPHAMLFEANADFASTCFGKPVGRLISGALADVIIADYIAPTPLCAGNIDAHILFGLSGRSIIATVVNGRILMKNREIIVADARKIAVKSRELAQELWKRF